MGTGKEFIIIHAQIVSIFMKLDIKDHCHTAKKREALARLQPEMGEGCCLEHHQN